MRNATKIIFTILFISLFSLVSFSKYEKEINIVVDAGHGGDDFGAEFNDVIEKNIVSAISNKIFLLNKNEKIKIHLTRIEDENINLFQRVAIINSIKPDLIISLHLYKEDVSDSDGFEIFVSEKSDFHEQSLVYAKNLKSLFSEKYPLKNKGIKNAPFMILKKSKAPSITLELGNISKTKDLEFLNNDTNQDRIALLLLEFLSSLKN